MGGMGDDEADSLLKDDRVSNQNPLASNQGHHSPVGAVNASTSTRPMFNRTPNADKSRRQNLTPKSAGGKLVRRTLDYPETPIENANALYDSRVTDPSIGLMSHVGVMDEECQKWCRVSGVLPGAVGGRSRTLHEMFDREGKNGLIRIKESAGDSALLQFRTKADAKLARDSHKKDDGSILNIEQLNEQSALKLGLDVRINSDGVCDIDDRCGGGATSRAPIVLRSFAIGSAGGGADRALGELGQVNRPSGLKIITASTNQNAAGGSDGGETNREAGGAGGTGLVRRPHGLKMEISRSLTDPKFCAVRPIRRDSCCEKIMRFFSMVTSDQQGEDR